MTRVHCIDCGEELWGADERHGQCMRCQQREHDAERDYETPDDEDECTAESNSHDTSGESK